MKEIKNSFIKEYEYGDYRIYVKEITDAYEFYLQHKDYGIISLMYGGVKADIYDIRKECRCAGQTRTEKYIKET